MLETEPLTKEEIEAANKLTLTMSGGETEEAISKLLQGSFVFNPFIRTLLNQN